MTCAGRRKLLSAALAALLALASLAFASQSSAAIGPKWKLQAFSNTTVAPGSTLTYVTEARNVGDAAWGGAHPAPPEWAAHLPEGMTVLSANVLDFRSFEEPPCFDAADGTSSPVGARDIVCPNTYELRPSDFQQLQLVVAVDSGASGTLVSEFAVSGGGAAPVETVDPILVSSQEPGFGIDAFDGQVSADALGSPFTQAGGHPFDAKVSIDFNTVQSPRAVEAELWPAGPLKNVLVDLPPGFLGNPTVGERCTLAQLANMAGPGQILSECPVASQVGTVDIRLRGAEFGPTVFSPPVFNMVPPPDAPARFGFNISGTIIVLDGDVRSSGDYGVSVNTRSVPQAVGIAGSTFTFWGVPASADHDPERACPGQGQPWVGGPTCDSDAPLEAFLRNPTSCTPPGVGLPTTARIDAWDNPGVFEQASFVSHLPPAYPLLPSEWGAEIGPTGCDQVPFDPAFAGEPTSPQAGKPSGFSFDLGLPQNDDPGQVGQSDLRKAVVTLPAGLRVSASSAAGLGACSPAQIGLDREGAPSCPPSSKIGELEVETPLLEEPLGGAVYLASPQDNEFGSLLAIYLVAEGPGVVLKLPGRVDSDPLTGQLTATFDDNPQLPFSNLHLEMKSGPRAPLTMPAACGTYTIHSQLTSWSGRVVELDSPFTVDQGCEARGFAPRLDAGLQNPLAATTSPFFLRLTREDSDQELGSLAVEMPEGLTAVLKGVPRCPEPAISAAAARGGIGQGAAELAAPSCPAASQVGRVTVGAGAGSSPFFVDIGRAYLAGPYKGAPLSLVVVTPAVAGPFDLGSVAVRAAIEIDPSTARVSVASDPLPRILHGIPLDIRDLRVSIDRPDFTLAPTSCDPMSIDARLASLFGARAEAKSQFQVGRCDRLGFKPRLRLSLGGGTRRGQHPAFKAVLTARKGDANIAKARVTLPHSEFLEQAHIRTICTRVQFAQGSYPGEMCPKGSLYGHARAITPLLDEPLAGPVFLRSSSNPLPDLVAALHSGTIDINLVGRIDSVGKDGRIRNTFQVVPDAPVSSFALTMRGGKKGLLVNSRNICRGTHRASAEFDGHNGKVHDFEPKLRAKCEGKGGGKRRGG